MKGAAGIFGEVLPVNGFYQCFHVGDALDLAAVLIGPVKAQRRAPVMGHKDYVIGNANLLPQGKKIFSLFRVGVTFGSRILELLGITHADQVTGNQPAEASAMGHDIAPQVG